jgi:hypothetical protein
MARASADMRLGRSLCTTIHTFSEELSSILVLRQGYKGTAKFSCQFINVLASTHSTFHTMQAQMKFILSTFILALAASLSLGTPLTVENINDTGMYCDIVCPW